ncbi:transposase [Solirubrobacter sp. CPCC 204708]|uniref:Transposase n=1 Tax=Solirubrobacter deserti TaxID=2282478 RepID=A0ABT4RVF2_9ACTN|nr:transposase [Solirubrobacter deserti]MBE2321067.1 transposase [Solirubrobacter deserti]MDA0142545.1 transposase [Solirubrobacter deserti]
MAQRFIACDREQSFLMPPDVREWLPDDHFAWFVLDAVESMDLDAFYAVYRADGRARPAFDPAMMVALILYAYARGTRSSRAIERACIEDIAYRVIAAQRKPDHATVARFVERHQDALAGVFGEVLGLCARAGLVGLNIVAIDGSKIAANASWEANCDYERLARETIEDAQRIDAEEDERFGDRRGDELPPELATSGGRKAWFKVARRQLDDQRAEQAAPIPRDRPKRVREAKRRMDEQLFTELRAEEAYQRYRARGKDRRGGRLGPNTVPRPYVPPPVPEGEINTTDPDSRMVKGQHQFIQGYNAQAATNEHRIVIGAETEVVSPDFGHLERTLNAARRELQHVGITEAPKLVVADSGYWHTEQMQRLAAEGIPVLIFPDSGLRTTPRPGWTGGLYDFMRRVLASEHRKALYHQRQHLIESLFGNTKHNRGFKQFHRRGRAAIRTEWRLITTTHNLLKLHQHQIATATA